MASNGKCEAEADVKDSEKDGGYLTYLTSRPLLIIGLCLVFVIIYTIALTVGMVLAIRNNNNSHVDTSGEMTGGQGAVVCDHETCSEIGRDIFKKGGSAVDAAIATLLCAGLMSPHSMGIGGGNFMVIYDAETKKTLTINARETAPSGLSLELNTQTGPRQKALSIGVPGEVMGYWEAHRRYGRLPWKDLFRPAIDLAENGHYLAYTPRLCFEHLLRENVDLSQDKEFCKVYCDDTGKIAPEGALIKRPRLAQTLKGIADNGPAYIHEGPVADVIAREIQSKGGVITKKDLAEYAPVVDEGISIDLGDVKLLTMGAPSGGPILGLILNILQGLKLSAESLSSTEQYTKTLHIVIEAVKLAFGERWQLGDPAFVPKMKEVVDKMTSEAFADELRSKLDQHETHESSYYTNTSFQAYDHGTAHVSVLAPDGSAVAVTSSIDYFYGSTIMSESTGIIWNNEMTDFSKDNPRNQVQPGKRPLSSMVPSIFVDKSGLVRLVIGGAGGMSITPVVAEVSAHVLFLGDTLGKAMRRKRFYHQLEKNVLVYEKGFPQDILQSLSTEFGHEVAQYPGYMAVLQAIERHPVTGEITGFPDERKIYF
ncbi:gamma-glutamyltranspeptidase 1-like isoform X2 [Mizuhopecten yessoensis]|uniref:gamma-glutamyltranspeptidase 1-like isoform X2 n=1 Tax=Mizuhopecten yessoensis TaxID=6573 RepID=UPI000B45C189|nr:gamma-glutamyltranspeptidase 1-like isoform X2 [Mizuhopecten yessoensis]